jgi:WD repeat-containing protein 68
MMIPGEANSSTTEDSHPEAPSPGDHSEICSLTASWPVYALSFTVSPNAPLRLAFSSCIEDPANYIQVAQISETTGQFTSLATFQHLYPPSKIMWIPDKQGNRPDLLATSGDGVRVWLYGTDTVLKTHLQGSKNGEFAGPLTSFDWNQTDLSLIAACSIDSTVSLWDLDKSVLKTQLIAHDREVFDIAFAPGVNQFATASADGSLRLFDLRSAEQSTVVFENGDQTPLLRLAWNKVDAQYVAALSMDSALVVVVDLRFPSVPVARLCGHQNNVNCVDWAPHSAYHMCTAGDDSQTLIWDLRSRQQETTGSWDPLLSYTASAEVVSMQWAPMQPEWIAIAFNRTIQALKV